MAKSQTESYVALKVSLISVNLDAEGFDNALRDHGVKFVHWRAMRCPVGLTDKFSERRPHPHHQNCSNGFVYTKAGVITGLFTSNSNKNDQNDVGILDGGNAQVTLPRQYDDTEREVQITPFDRLYLAEDVITVPTQQLVETHITGRDRLLRPIVEVIDILDAGGKTYGAEDYSIVDGQIVWRNGGPGYNADLEKGIVYAIRYTYRPYWYVDRIIHQIRVARVDTGLELKLMRMPQSFSIAREYVFEKEENDRQSPTPDSPRQVKEAGTGVFGPR
jgi:hypothetical protein